MIINLSEARDMQADVRAFCEAVGHTPAPYPQFPDSKVADRRYELVREEIAKLRDAALYNRDLEGVTDAIADAIYVLLGMALVFGIDINPVWDAVHKANMTRVAGPKRDDGKQLKIDRWEAPDIAGILQAQIEAGRED